jgi:hypothetical protein
MAAPVFVPSARMANPGVDHQHAQVATRVDHLIDPVENGQT